MKVLLLCLFVLNSLPAFSQEPPAVKKISLEVTQHGFVPNSIDVSPGTDVTLEVTRKTDMTCAKDILFPTLKIPKTALPLNKAVLIPLGKLAQGEIRFTCGMKMENGQIHVH